MTFLKKKIPHRKIVLLRLALVLGIFYYAVLVMIATVSLLNYFVFNYRYFVEIDFYLMMAFSIMIAINTSFVTKNFYDIYNVLKGAKEL